MISLIKSIDVIHASCLITATKQKIRMTWLGQSGIYRHKLIKFEQFAYRHLKDNLPDDSIKKLKHILILTSGVL